MALPPQGRNTASSSSAKLGAKDPRPRRAAQAGLTNNEIGDGLEMASGKVRIAAFDGISALPENATLAQTIARLNLLLRKGQGA